MSLLTTNSTVAERRNGCVLAELLKSSALVTANDGVITGTPTFSSNGATFSGSNDYINYGLTGISAAGGMTIVGRFMMPDTSLTGAIFYTVVSATDKVVVGPAGGSLRFRFVAGGNDASSTPLQNNTWYNFMATWDGADAKLYLNGVIQSGTDGFSIVDTPGTVIGANTNAGADFTGTISYIKVFKGVVLTAEDAANYHNNANYNYEQKATLHWPLLSANHDASYSRTLDVSGNGFHGSFGGNPTKDTTRGYTTDGNDYIQSPTGIISAAPKTITQVTAFRLADTASNYSPGGYETDGGSFGAAWLYNSSNNKIQYFVGSGTSTAAANITAPSAGDICVCVGIHDGTNTKINFNGRWGTNASSPVAPGGDSNSRMTIFSRADGSTSAMSNGSKVFYNGFWKFAFGKIQTQDIISKILRSINQV